MWRRRPEQLTYSLLSIHDLLPAPSRMNNNHSLTLMSCAAAPWRKTSATPTRLTTLSDVLHTTASFSACFDATSTSNRLVQNVRQ